MKVSTGGATFAPGMALKDMVVALLDRCTFVHRVWG